MAYVVTRRPQIALAFSGLGAARRAAPVIGAYYAKPSELRWSSSALRGLHDSLRNVDLQWQSLMLVIPVEAIPLIPEEAKQALRIAAAGPLPIFADTALILEAVAGARPLSSSFKGTLEILRERALEVAATFTAIGSIAGSLAIASALASVGATASVAGAPADIVTLPTAADLGIIAGLAGTSAALWGALEAILDGLERGELSEDDYEKLVRGTAAAMGKHVTDQQIADSAATFYGAQEAVTGARADALAEAKRKSIAKATACTRRGGVYDPTAPSGCRVPQRPPTKTEKQIKVNVAVATGAAEAVLGKPGDVWWDLGIGALALGGAYALWRAIVGT